jgi:hypothetical protein
MMMYDMVFHCWAQRGFPAADQHLESSTKRTLVENESMAAELEYHAQQSNKLVAANNTLRAEAAELRREVEVAHKTGQCC